MFFHRLRLALIVAAVFALVPVVVVGSSTSAEALQGCPPQSSICNPAVLAAIAVNGDAALASAIGVTGTAASAATGVSTTSAVVSAGSTLAVALTGYAATQMVIDTLSTDLFRSGGSYTRSHNFPGGPLVFELAFDSETGLAGLLHRAPAGTWATSSGNASWVTPQLTTYFGNTTGLNMELSCINAVGASVSGTTKPLGNPSSWRVSGSNNGVPYYLEETTSWTCPAGTHPRASLVQSSTGLNVYIDWAVESGQPLGFVGEFQITQSCKDVNGVVTTSVRSVAVSSPDASVPVDIPEGKCAARSVLQSVVIDWVTSQGRENVYDWSAPDWVLDVPTEYPDCLDQECFVELWMVTGSGLDWCGQGAVACQNWWKDTAKVDNYRCKYGPYTVALGYCAMFRYPGSISSTVPLTETADGSKLAGGPIVSTDAKDFESIDRQMGYGPYKPPATDPDPGTGGVTDPEPLPEGGGSACWPQGWGVWNPLEWVYRPITCALAWAWVPEPGPLMEDTDAVVKTGLLGEIGDEISAFDNVSWPGESSTCALLYQGSPSVFQGQTLSVTPCGPIATAVAGVVKPLLTGVIFVGGIIIAVAVILQAFDVNIMMGRAEQAAER